MHYRLTYLVGKPIFLIGGEKIRDSFGTCEHCGEPAQRVIHLKNNQLYTVKVYMHVLVSLI